MPALRRLIGLAALSALVVVAVPTAGAQTPTVTSVIGSADGLSVDVEVDEAIIKADVGALATLAFGPEPSVTLPSEGGSVSEQVLGVDESVVLLSLTAAVLRTSAEGALGPQGFATAETTVADIELAEVVAPREAGVQQLTEPILAAEAITATCAADLTGVSGSTTLVGASVLGTALDAEPDPNTELEVVSSDLATVGVTLNRQVQNSDGSLSVTALVLEINVGEGLITGTLEIGPATCGVVEGEVPSPAPAPVPAPVSAQVRFTG